MKRFLVLPPCVLLSVFFFALWIPVDANMQSERAPVTAGQIVQIQWNALTIVVDDNSPPFKLQNLGERFTAPKLEALLDSYVEFEQRNKRTVYILVQNQTKRTVDGEPEFDEHLKSLARNHGAVVIYFPLPRSDSDPDMDLRIFADEFKRTHGM